MGGDERTAAGVWRLMDGGGRMVMGGWPQGWRMMRDGLCFKYDGKCTNYDVWWMMDDVCWAAIYDGCCKMGNMMNAKCWAVVDG